MLNFSESGAKIASITHMVESFKKHDENADNVDKIVLCLGTNDIKHSKNGVSHLRPQVFSLVNRIKDLFPGVNSLVFSTLPMARVYNYTVHNCYAFNDILKEVCYKTNSYYVDCFDNFLTSDRFDINNLLYKDCYHLNKKGVGVLCSILKMVINCDYFTSILRCEYFQ